MSDPALPRSCAGLPLTRFELRTALNQIRIFTSSASPAHHTPFFHDNPRLRITKFLTNESLDVLLSCRTQAICWHLHHQVRVNAGAWDNNSRQKVRWAFGRLFEELIRTIKDLKLGDDVRDVDQLVEEIFADWITVVGFRRVK